MQEKLFCKGGGCTAKLGAGVLSHVLERLPKGEKDENLLVGYDSKDDAAVYRISKDTAMVQTLDFFPPMIEDPYLFGQIAAANALSDIFAMGGEVKTALNIVCFPENMDLNILGEIMRGGSEKVMEAGGVLAGGHSIADDGVKYGLSVTGVVNPEKIWANNTGKPGDKLVLTKKLGAGIICTANRIGEASKEAMEAVIRGLVVLYAHDILGRNVVTIHTRVEPAAAVFPEEPIDGEQNASAVGAGDDTAFGGGVHMENVIQNRIFRFIGQAEILQKAQTEAVLGLGIKADVHFAAFGHHHAKVLLHFLRRVIDHMVGAHFVNQKHNVLPVCF